MKSFDPDDETPLVDTPPEDGVQLDDDLVEIDADRALSLIHISPILRLRRDRPGS